MPTNYNPDTDALETMQERFAREAEVDERIMRGELGKGAKTEPWAYGIVRDGEQVGVERSLAVAKQWVDAEYIPLVPMQQRDELLAAVEVAMNCIGKTRPSRQRVEAYMMLQDAIASVKGGAA